MTMQGFPIVFARCGVLLAFLCCGASANVCRVTTGGTNLHDGSTWSVPMDLQTALGTSTCTEIWVAAGSYLPTTPGGSYNTSFVIAPGTAVYGGFAGSETERTQRNFNANVSTLSGDIGVVGVASDNSHLIVRMTGTVGNTITASTVLDGFTISGAYQGGNGGGMYCNGSGTGNECSPTLANLVFADNYAVYGGGLYNDGHGGGVSSPHLTNVTFKDNVVVNEGGALYNDGSGVGSQSNPVLNGVTFSGNGTDNDIGGAMEDYGNSNPVLTNVTFSGNGSHLAPNGLLTWNTQEGGAIALRGGGGAVLNNVTFSGNSATAYGGAIYNSGGTVLMSNTILWGDSTTGMGPEIYQSSGTTNINASVVQGGCPNGVTCFGVITTDPLLGALQDNGGPTQTMMLLAGSSAIDGGYNPACATQDQRGVPRPQGANCDVGAVEVVLDRVFADNFDGRPTP